MREDIDGGGSCVPPLGTAGCGPSSVWPKQQQQQQFYKFHFKALLRTARWLHVNYEIKCLRILPTRDLSALLTLTSKTEEEHGKAPSAEVGRPLQREGGGEGESEGGSRNAECNEPACLYVRRIYRMYNVHEDFGRWKGGVLPPLPNPSFGGQ